jgi:hypothetical protein
MVLDAPGISKNYRLPDTLIQMQTAKMKCECVGTTWAHSVHLLHDPPLHGGVNILKHPRPSDLCSLTNENKTSNTKLDTGAHKH